MSNWKQMLAMIIIAILTSTLTIHFLSKPSTQSQDTLKKVLDSGEIKVGYVINPPSLIKNPNTGKLSGIYYEALDEMGKNMGLKIKWAEEVGWGTMIQGLETGRYDIVVGGIWPSATRAKRVNFSIPLYFSAVAAYVKAGDTRFNDITKINNKKITIAVVDGDTSSIIAHTAFPDATQLSLPQETPLSHLLLNVQTGKADITFVEKVIAEDFSAHNPGTIQNATPKTPIRIFGNTILIPKNQSGFEGLINTALGELINSNRAKELVKKYEKYPNSLYVPAQEYQ
jgi:polar amino acid transport system substrate-binding protein